MVDGKKNTGDVKSQFGVVGYTANNYLLDSFSVMVEDTRGGVNAATAAKFNSMTGFASANPDKTNGADLAQYIKKMTGAADEAPEAKVTIAQRAKLSTGIK